MRALVTGGSGFVGTWLVRHLRARGDDVVSVDHEVDVTDGAAMKALLSTHTPKAIYHLAALTHVGRSWTDPAEVFRVNATGTLNVLEAARACAEPPRVLITSSAEVYGAATEDQLPLTESSALAPVTPYGASKVAAEFLGIQAHLGHGLEVVMVRPFNHIGPGQASDFVVSSL
ncbi:MAG: GDP-mannose 4,6-dehydratase, partial [Acidimicrobiales bacterium]